MKKIVFENSSILPMNMYWDTFPTFHKNIIYLKGILQKKSGSKLEEISLHFCMIQSKF